MRFSWLVTAGVCAWLVACGSSSHKKALMCDASQCGPDLDAGAPGMGDGGAPGMEEMDASVDAEPGAAGEAGSAGSTAEGGAGSGESELQIVIEGNGTVAVSDQAACLAGPCSYPTSAGTSFSLQAKPGADSRFVGWSGDCAGTKPNTSLTVSGAALCTATFVVQRAVTATVAGSGGGTVVSNPDLSCGSLGCSGEVDNSSSITLTATPAKGFAFVSWSGGPECQGKTQASITVKVTQDLSCNATFAQQFKLAVSAAGANAPVGVATPAPIAGTVPQCDALMCAANAGDSASFHAEAAAGFRFTGWSGDALCTGTVNPLVIASVASDITCVANYKARLTATGVVAAGFTGTVDASSADVNATCAGNSCTLDAGTTATLKAPTITGSRLTGWSGAGCLAGNQSGNGITVTPTTSNVTCTANYAPGVSVTGTVVGATGSVIATSTSPGAACTPGACGIDSGGAVTLAAPNLLPTYRFNGWSGDAGCAGAALQITLSAVTSSKACSANYVQQFTIKSVANAGGTVTAKNGALACAGNSCTVDAGTSVALAAVADTANGYHFTTWSGAGCTPAAGNPLTLSNVNATCTAGFALDTFTIAATAGTNGSVSATSANPAQCTGSSCTVTFGVNVSLGATPIANYHFNGWTGAGCAPTVNNPLILKNLNANCSAAFAINTFAASVSAAPAAAGVVGITCPGNNCGAVPYGQLVNVTAVANPGWAFASWSANCGGGATSPNPVTITKDTACVATFRPIATAVTSPSGSGKITATSAAPACNVTAEPASCAVDSGGSVTFSVTPATNAVFTGWTGDCTGTGTTVTLSAIAAPKSCVANFYNLWAQASGTNGNESMTHVTTLADGTVIGLGVARPVGAKDETLSLATLDANTGKITRNTSFVDANADQGFAALGLTTNSTQKAAVALAQHAATRQPYLHNEANKWDAEYKYSGGGATLVQGGEVINTLDGGYAFVVGILDPPPPDGSQTVSNAHLTKIDATGKPQFDVQFCLTSDPQKPSCLPTLPVDVLQDPETKNYAVLSQVLTPGYAIGLTFISEAGAVLGSTLYGDSQDLVGAQFVPGVGADTYLVVGTRTDAKGNSNGFYAELSRAAAAPRFAFSLGGTRDEHLFSVAKTAKGYGLAGLFNDAKQANEAWLVLIDANGGIKVQLAYGGTLGDRANAISNVPAGGFVLGGATLNWGQGLSDMWTVRIDPSGGIVFDTAVTPQPLTYAVNLAAVSLTTAVTSRPVGVLTPASSASQIVPAVKSSTASFGQVQQTP